MTYQDALKAQVAVVARARMEAQRLREAKAVAVKMWEEQNADLLGSLTSTTEYVGAMEQVLREMTLQAYRETGNKAPAEGVGVREVTKLEYQEAEAYVWALDHKVALRLDINGFEKLAKVTPLPFVETKKEPQATIAQDLSKFVEGR